MSPESISGRTPRTYRSQLRQQQAEATRARVVAAAADLFAADGYARTTLAKIAGAAGVSPETVQGQGPKAALLVAALEDAAFGVIGDANILELDFGRRLLAADDFGSALDLLVETQTEVHVRTAGLTTALLGAAAAEPELHGYLDGMFAEVNRQVRRVVEVWRDRGWLRSDIPFGEIVETVVVLASIETFLRMTHRDGWTADNYRDWLRRMLTEAILRAPQRN